MGSKPRALIIGGTSGLGLELAEQLKKDYFIFVVGRTDPKKDPNEILHLMYDLNRRDANEVVENIICDVLPQRDSFLHLLIYCAGFYQEGRIDELNPFQIEKMINIGLTVPAILLRHILHQQGSLPGFIAITSTSQFTPRSKEPICTAVKSGLAMLANSASLGGNIDRTLVVAPAGMHTTFYRDISRDLEDFLNPGWVSERILELYDGDYQYRFAKILRDPPRVITEETR